MSATDPVPGCDWHTAESLALTEQAIALLDQATDCLQRADRAVPGWAGLSGARRAAGHVSVARKLAASELPLLVAL